MDSETQQQQQLQQQLHSIRHGPSLPPSPTPASPLLRFKSIVASADRDNLAVVSRHQRADLFSTTSIPLDSPSYRQSPYLRWSFSTLAAQVSRLKDGLANLGVEKQTPVFLFMGNRVEYLLLLLAAMETGAVLVPIHSKNLENRTEVEGMWGIAMDKVGREKKAIVITGDEETAQGVDALEAASSAVKVVLEGQREGWLSFETLLRDASVVVSDVREAADK